MSKNYLTERERSARKVNYHLLRYVDLDPEGWPIIHAQQIPKHIKRLIGFNEVLTCKNPTATGVHFFIDDYQFERVWEQPERYVDKLLQFPLICEPDFSLYGAYPEPVQKWNHYRNQLIAAYLQAQGGTVIATPSWNGEESFEWCFTGIEEGAPVAISTVGVGHAANLGGFMRGVAVLYEQKKPGAAIVYGKMLDALRVHLEKHSIPYTHYLNGQAMRVKDSEERRCRAENEVEA